MWFFGPSVVYYVFHEQDFTKKLGLKSQESVKKKKQNTTYILEIGKTEV